MFDAVQALIGTVPAGFEPVVYVLCIPVLLWLLSQFSACSGLSLEGLPVLDDLNGIVGFILTR